MSDDTERSFSSGCDLITYRRSGLLGDVIEACEFLHNYYGEPQVTRTKSGDSEVTIPPFDEEDTYIPFGEQGSQ